MRVRTRGDFTGSSVGVANITQIDCAGNTKSNTSWNSPIVALENETTYDVVTPGYRRRVAAGEIINNPYENLKVKRSGYVSGQLVATYTPTCSGSTTKKEYHTNNDVSGWNNSYTWTGWQAQVGRAQSIASTNALANVAKPDVEGQVELAELSKAFRLLRNPLREMSSYLKKVQFGKKRSSYKKVDDAARYLANEWLKWRYGIYPMQKSAESAVKAIFGRDSALRRASPRHTARSWHAEEFDKLEKSETKTWTWSTSNYKHTYSGNVVARAGVLYDFQFSLGTSFGLHLHEVPSTLWELVPGSFVWDWWFNTGKYIRAITPKIGVRTLASWVRVTATYDYAYELSSSARTVANWSISDNRKAGFEEQRVHTRRYPGVRPAHVMYKLPSKQTEADKARTVDAISLILQQLKGK